MDTEDANNHGGIWTLMFDDGRVVVEDVRDSDGRESRDEGAYCVSGERVSIALGQSDGCPVTVLFSASWETAGREPSCFGDVLAGGVDRGSRLSDALWGSTKWTRID